MPACLSARGVGAAGDAGDARDAGDGGDAALGAASASDCARGAGDGLAGEGVADVGNGDTDVMGVTGETPSVPEIAGCGVLCADLIGAAGVES